MTDIRVRPLAAVKPVIGRAFAVCANAEQAAESVERVEAAIEAEGKFVEVGLQVLRLDAPVVRTLQPSFEVAENQVDNRQVFFRNIGLIGLDNRHVGVGMFDKSMKMKRENLSWLNHADHQIHI